jgi:beta-lactamase class A
MTKIFNISAFLCLFVSSQTFAQSIDSLRQRIAHIVSTKNAFVGVAIAGPNGQDTMSINGGKGFPMQSVFKFHIGSAMLAEVDKGNYALDQKIKIEKAQLLPELWSPIREKYPEGATLSLAEILEYTISQSDNVGCDLLLRLLGGPQLVEGYFKKNGIEEISIKINEELMQQNWDLQFENWTTPKAANQALEIFFNNKDSLLSPQSHAFLWKVMRETSTGKNRLRGKLPPETIVAHKTGWSGKHKTTGITAAVNDIGIVFLPNGAHFFISVFVTESKEDFATNEAIIAEVAKAAWDCFLLR